LTRDISDIGADL